MIENKNCISLNHKCSINLETICQNTNKDKKKNDDILKKILIDNDFKTLAKKKKSICNIQDNIYSISKKNDLNYNLLGTGGFNSAFLIENHSNNSSKKDNSIKRVLRISHKPLSQSLIDNELLGLHLGKYFSTICDNINKVYDYGIYKSTNKTLINKKLICSNGVYGILEYCEGGSLKDIIDQQRSKKKKFLNICDIDTSTKSFFPINDIIRIMKQLFKGLECIHKHKFGHFDIKPDNILFTDKTLDHLRIIDFGFVKQIPDKYIYLDGGYFGTPGYMPPEFLIGINYGDNKINDKADVWSCAVILLELILGINLSKCPKIWDEKLGKDFGIIISINPDLIFNYDPIKNLIIKKTTYTKNNKSYNAINLLKNMFSYNQDNRNSIQDCLKDDWLTNFEIKKYIKSYNKKKTSSKQKSLKKKKYKKTKKKI